MKETLIHISIVSPVYNAGQCINELIERLTKVLKLINCSYEVILVNDASTDNSWNIIKQLSSKNIHIKAVNLSRNFGQHHTITAGIDLSCGDWVVVMDCDLQDRPEEISNLYNKAKDNFDIVLARRINRKDGFFPKTTSAFFGKVINYLSGSRIDSSVANFGIYSKKVIDEVKKMKEPIRCFPVMVNWMGYNKTTIDVKHAERFKGKSTYNFSKRLSLGLNIILAYSDKPLRLAINFGLVISLISFIFGIIVLIKYLNGKIGVSGYTSLILAICFFSGIIITLIGLVGLYVGKTFEATKNRPLYLISESVNI